jgi:hypothetical protein
MARLLYDRTLTQAMLVFPVSSEVDQEEFNKGVSCFYPQ